MFAEEPVTFNQAPDDTNQIHIRYLVYSSLDDLVKPKMNCSVKIIVSWVMILNLALGFMPVSSAPNLDSNHHATNYELMLLDSIDRDQIGSLGKSDLFGCQDFLVCTVHYSCVPLHSSSVLTVTPQTLVHRTIPIGDARVLTRYLDIPRRPPRT